MDFGTDGLITPTTPATPLSITLLCCITPLNTQSNTMNTPKTVSCVLIDSKCKILHRPFCLSISPSKFQLCDVIFPLLRVAVPALRDQEDRKLKLYKPLTAIPRDQQSNLTEEQVNLADPLPSSRLLRAILPCRPSDVDLVISVPDSQCLFLHLLTDKVSDTFLQQSQVHFVYLSHRKNPFIHVPFSRSS